MGKQFENVFIGTRMRKSTEVELLIRASQARSTFIGIRGCQKNGRKEAKPKSSVEEIDETR